MVIKIKDLPSNERPCERLINMGVESISNEELIAIIFKTGNKSLSAKELASQVLSQIDDLKNVTYNSLLKINGIGKMKAASLLAAIELGKRVNNTCQSLSNQKLNSTTLVYEYFKNILTNKKQEHFYCIYLDNAKKVIKEKLLFIGTINYSIVHPREIFKEAYLLSASAIICIHNHPSNNLTPSNEDVEITKRLVSIGELLGIKIIDHIIIGENNYFSFFENEII